MCAKNAYESTCPDPQRRPVYVCSGCGDDICEGENVYHIMGEQFCEKCIEKAKEEVKLDDSYREELF